ncbi:MAG: hypothetical protein HQL11_05285, partial [Candidatus Omnitrophica bacterium]|nr:hypothetical protein [Candidatus Omnitrophota bacterium]
RNLRACFSGQMSPRELKAILKESYRHFAMSMAELLLITERREEEMRGLLEVEHLETLDRLLSAGRGVILLCGHFGNWEFSGLMAGVLNYPIAVLVKPQKHPKSDAFLNGLRGSRGALVVQRGMAVRQIPKLLSKGGIVGILADQDAGTEGVFVDFFG